VNKKGERIKTMINVIGVRFRRAGKIYFFDPAGFSIKQGDNVIVETARGIEYFASVWRRFRNISLT